MAQHGYLREYDEGYGRSGDRERDWSERDWADRQRERGFMFDDRERDEQRRMSRYGPEHGYGGFQGDYGRSGREQGGFGGSGDYERGRTSFTANPDDHYRSWRQKQIETLDRDYEDYCREREQQFHQSFDAWRSQRHGNPPPLQAGMTQTSTPGDTDGTLELSNEAGSPAEGGQDPMATATMGTTSSGRGRR